MKRCATEQHSIFKDCLQESRAPRGVQHTVRLNIVKTVVEGMPVIVGMVEKEDESTKRTYHALYTVKMVDGNANGRPSTEGFTPEE